jgi:hypothetical protein
MVVVPTEDVVLESTWCGCEAEMDYRRKASWGSHTIITNNGIAFLAPQSSMPGVPTIPTYFPWGEAFSIQISPRLGMRFEISFFTLRLIHMPQRETKAEFDERNDYFIARFRPILIEKKTEWIKQNRGTPDRVMQRHIKASERMISKMKKQEKKRISKY